MAEGKECLEKNKDLVSEFETLVIAKGKESTDVEKEKNEDLILKPNIRSESNTRAKVTREAISNVIHTIAFKVRQLLFDYSLAANPGPVDEIRKLTKIYQNRMLEECNKEIDLLFVEEGIVEKLDQLDLLDKQQRHFKSLAWRPSGNPEDDIAATEMEVLEEEERFYEELYKKETVRFDNLRIELLQLRKIAESMSVSFKEDKSERDQKLKEFEESLKSA